MILSKRIIYLSGQLLSSCSNLRRYVHGKGVQDGLQKLGIRLGSRVKLMLNNSLYGLIIK